jgi:hypothetical protein
MSYMREKLHHLNTTQESGKSAFVFIHKVIYRLLIILTKQKTMFLYYLPIWYLQVQPPLCILHLYIKVKMLSVLKNSNPTPAF